MSGIVEIKYWHYLILLILSTYAVWLLIVLPVLQKYIYRRFQATERRLDEELEFGLPGYAIASRELWIDRLLSDPEVQKTIDKLSVEQEVSVLSLTETAKEYAGDMVPSFNAVLYFKFGSWLSRIMLRLYYWVKVGYRSEHYYDHVSKDDCVVVVSNHRSNFDPFLLMYLASKKGPISYAAGKWSLGFPFKQIVHALGACIIRNDRKDDKLYHCLLERYVFLAASQCVPQGIFLEGGLSRDGKMQPLHLGLLSYLLKADQEGVCKDIVFIPAAVNYDKVPELKTLVSHQKEGFSKKGRFYSLFSFVKFLATVGTYMIPRRHKPHGYASVNFGKPISLAKWQQDNAVDIKALGPIERHKAIDKLGDDLAFKIGKIIPMLATNILACVFDESEEPYLSEIELKTRSMDFIKKLKEKGIVVSLPRNDENYALSQGIYILIREKIITPIGDGRFTVVEGSEALLAYYRDTVPT